MLRTKAVEEQTSMIVEKMNSLLLMLAYDGRPRIKVRFQESEISKNTYLIEVNCGQSVMQNTLDLNFNPFSMRYWSYVKKTIKKHLNLPKCKKSRYGGYTFYA